MGRESVNWTDIPGPVWYSPERVQEALRTLVSSMSDVLDPGAGVRSALGNDHAGTLYPAAVAGTAHLLDIIAEYPGAPRQIALSILVDWWGCFVPEPGYERYEDQNGVMVEVVPAIMRRVEESTEILQVVAQSDPDSRRLVIALLSALECGWTVAD